MISFENSEQGGILINKRTISWGAMLVLSLGLLAYTLMHFALAKQGFHIDEIYSYGLSNSYYNPFPIAANEWVAGSYYQDYLMPHSSTQFQYGSVISNQVNDVHPPLYYLLFHTIASIWPAEFSPLVGLSLNILAHVGTVVVVGLMMHLLTRNVPLSIVTGLFWGMSIGGLSSMLFIRMYHLMGFFVALLAYLVLAYIRSHSKWSFGLLILIFLTTFAGALTHYYFYIYAFFIVAVTCLALLFLKSFGKALVIGVSALGAIACAWAFFPAIFIHITQSNRGVEVLNNANDGNLTENLRKYLAFIQEDLLADVPFMVFTLIVIAIGLLLIFKSNKLRSKMALVNMALLMVPAALYIFLVQDLSHYHTARYIYPIYPIVIIIISLALYYGLRTFLKKGLATAMVTTLVAVIIAFGFRTETVDFQYHDQGQLNETLSSLPKDNAMVFSQTRWKIAEYAPQLAQFQQIYPMVLTSTEVDALPNLTESQQGQALTVFTNNSELDPDALIASILEKYGLHSFEIIHQFDDLTVYQFS